MRNKYHSGPHLIPGLRGLLKTQLDSLDHLENSEVPTPTKKRIPQSAEKYWAPGEESLQGLTNYQRDLKMIADWFYLNAHLIARGEDEAFGYPIPHTPAMDLRDLR